MEWESCRSPEVSDNEQEFDVELELNSRIILEHYRQTGEFLEPPKLLEAPPIIAREYESPTKKYEDSVKSKILELEEEESNLMSRMNLESRDGNWEGNGLDLMVPVCDPLLQTQYVIEQTECVLKMKLERHYSQREEVIKKETTELLNKLKLHERFIVELLFSLKLVERLESLETMLEVAEGNYEGFKDKARKKLEEESRMKREAEERVRDDARQRERNQAMEKEKAERQRNEQFRASKQNYYRCFQKQTQFYEQKQSPTKLFKPHNKSLEFAGAPKSFTTGYPALTKKGNIENSNISKEYPMPPVPNRSPTKPRTSFAFERKGSYITNSPKKIQPTQAPLQQRLQEQLQLLSSGKTFRKRCPFTGTEEEVDVYCSPDYSKLMVRSSNYDCLIEQTRQISDVKTGRLINQYQRHLQSDVHFEDGVSFSIVFGNRMVELQAKSTGERNEFVNALQELRKLVQR